jgi:hypothetical protein
MTQPTALFLADILEDAGKPADIAEKCAAELRQLHEANEAFGKRQEWWNERMFVLEQQRDALLEALKLIVEFVDAPTEGKRPDVFVMRISKARAAIKKAEENA